MDTITVTPKQMADSGPNALLQKALVAFVRGSMSVLVYLVWTLILKGIFWNQMKALASFALLLLIAGVGGLIVIPFNLWLTEYSISRDEKGNFHHDQDLATTLILDDKTRDLFKEQNRNREAYLKIWTTQLEDGHAPKIRWSQKQDDFSSWLKATLSGDGKTDSYYNSFTNTTVIKEDSPLQSLIAENAHAIQFRQNPYRSYGLMTVELTRAFGCAVKNLPQEFLRNYKTGYDRPGTIEYQAHKEIEPRLIRENQLEEILAASEKHSKQKAVSPEPSRASGKPDSSTWSCAPPPLHN